MRTPPKRRNPQATVLRSRLFRQRKRPSAKIYRRKGRDPREGA